MNILNTQSINSLIYRIEHTVITAGILCVILVIYIVFLIIRNKQICQYSQKLACTVNAKKRNYSDISIQCKKIGSKLNSRFYIFTHRNTKALLNQAKEICQYHKDLQDLSTCLEKMAIKDSLKIINQYKDKESKNYLQKEEKLFRSLCNEYKIQKEKSDRELKLQEKKRFHNIYTKLSKKVDSNPNLTLEEWAKIKKSVDELLAQCSSSDIYSEYKLGVNKLKRSIDKHIKTVQKIEVQKLNKRFSVEDTIVKILESANSTYYGYMSQTTINNTSDRCTMSSLKEKEATSGGNLTASGNTSGTNQDKECYVNFELKNTAPNVYPIVRTPHKGCIVWPYRRKQIARRGYTEETFQKQLSEYLSNFVDIFGDVNLLSQSYSQPYEPDIAIIDLKSGYNLRIDIEIDEPYSGLSNKPTHYFGCGDENRDANINRLGWVVVRFTEYQIHTQPSNCIALICRIIAGVIPNANFNKSTILSLKDPQNEKQWDLEDAQKLAKQRYRQKYLNHEFGVVESKEICREDVELSAFEQSIKDKVEHSAKVSLSSNDIGYNKNNSYSQDSDLLFDSVNHIYSYKGVVFKAVSTIVSEFFPVFNQVFWAERKAREYGIPTLQMIEEWEAKGNESREIGTFLHSQIENVYLNKPIERKYNYVYKGTYIHKNKFYDIYPKELQYFYNFQKDKSIKPYRTEWRIYCKRLKIAGTIDLIAKNGGVYDIYDWKRSSKIFINNPFQSGLGELSHLQDTTLNHYKIQQNLYRWILENEYNITIGNMYLVVLHPDFDDYKIIEVPRMDKEVKYIIDNL